MQAGKDDPQFFCPATLEKLMKYWPVGSYLVMNSNTGVPGGRPLIDIGYRYNYRNFIGSFLTEGDGSTEMSYYLCISTIVIRTGLIIL